MSSSIVGIPFQEILLATNDFAEVNRIASGGYGPVYQGESVNHGMIAVKRLDRKHGQGNVEFRREIDLLSEYKHENIVSLLGFCDENNEKILVYKLESNGSLDKHLNNKHLSWIQRLRICIDAARGLKYLHDDVGPQHRILHRDVKSANILLDEKWNAKISDFGLSRIAPANVQTTLVITNPRGTPGYIDPDYALTGSLTQKSDVYSFGVVLFEVLCGRLACVTAYKDKRRFLTALVGEHYKKQTLDKIIHFDIQNQISPTSLRTFSTIAYECLKNGIERPTMNKVVQQLQKALHNQLQQGSLSTSTSTHSIPTSPSKPWKYDVFFSFRGEDTYKIFVDHLYSYLSPQGINISNKDATLPRGKAIGPSLLNAVQNSRIALIIFSENYAGSSCCLDELAYIMKCKEERDQIVIPIYYGVDQLDVRRQKGKFGEAFYNHKSANNDKVESWRKALVDATFIDGLERIANGNETIEIEAIGSAILDKLLRSMPTVEAAEGYEANDDVDTLTKTQPRVCVGCNANIGYGKFLKCMGGLWHPECFRCHECNSPISDLEFSMSENRPFHKACYKEHYHPKCDVCKSFIPANADGMIEYRAHPFWRQKYCLSHELDRTPRCYSCERMEARDTKYLLLHDGRKLCIECHDSAVMDTHECQPLYLEIQDFYEGLNMKIEQQVPLLLVDRQALYEAMEGEKNFKEIARRLLRGNASTLGQVRNHLPEMRGICLSEEQTISTITRKPNVGAGRLTGNLTEPFKLVHRSEVTAILTLCSLPRLLTGSIIAHDMMYAWLRLKGYSNFRPNVKRGICDVLAHMWLDSEIMAGSGSTSVASSSSSSAPASKPSKTGKMSDFEKQLVEFLKYQIESNIETGDGFREGNNSVLKYGLRRTLDHIRLTGTFPL